MKHNKKGAKKGPFKIFQQITGNATGGGAMFTDQLLKTVST